jgi:uncharacterized protein (TIGR00369 family)
MSSSEAAPVPDLGPPIPDGVWAGWSKWTGEEPFEDHAGPFYAKRGANGGFICGFHPGARSLNGAGTVHGGALATFADYALFMIAKDALAGQGIVTVTLNTEFVGAGPSDVLLTAQGDVVRAGRSLIFVRGLIEAGDAPVLNFSGVLKIVRPKPGAYGP